jgi:hypothetical protein
MTVVWGKPRAAVLARARSAKGAIDVCVQPISIVKILKLAGAACLAVESIAHLMVAAGLRVGVMLIRHAARASVVRLPLKCPLTAQLSVSGRAGLTASQLGVAGTAYEMRVKIVMMAI